ncbi:MAG: autotransporter outer membrane beta-barrel domain-containing protein, partial [Sporomusa sp.]
SYADIKGNTLTLALALEADDKTDWGIFGRKFDGSYTTSHRASLASGEYTIHSDGDLKTHDIGLFAEYRPQGEKETGYYYQAIVRAGRSTNDFSTDTSYGASKFRSGRSLFGFSLGGGYAADIGRGTTADYYSHLIYTKLDGDSVAGSIEKNISLKSSESVRLMSGVQFTFNQNRKTQTYLGAALDYEFSGKVDTYINGLKADGAHLKGLSGIRELGLISKQSDTLTIDLEILGYVGKKKGLGGTLALSKKF